MHKNNGKHHSRGQLGNTLSRFFILLALLLGPSVTSAAGPIVLDGQFLDWTGQASIADTPGDCGIVSIDIMTFSFATNPDDPTAYFMAERVVGAVQPVGYLLYIDTNNNGIYSETTDRIVMVRYEAKTNTSLVNIELQDGAGATLSTIVDGANWGENLIAGGRKVEWGVSFAHLGITAGQAVRMYLTSKPGNTPGGLECDTTVEIQWSPANALGLPILVGVLLIGAGWLAYQRRKLA